MSEKKKILFLTGTRADFGKQKSLIMAVEKEDIFDISIFARFSEVQELYMFYFVLLYLVTLHANVSSKENLD